jgi:acetyl-CoA carboxylase carboxyl transferase subunit alpha
VRAKGSQSNLTVLYRCVLRVAEPNDENSKVNMWVSKQGMSPIDRVKLSRHPDRPYLLDYVSLLFSNFYELHGDRRFADDPAMICGFATFHNEPITVIGHQKGRNLKSRLQRNFGMAKPEGYRKALRVMRLAEKFNRPILTFVDIQGAYPGVDSEERSVAEAIAHNLREMSRLRVPIIATVIGEGGSGGALGIAVADRVLMQENTYYSVITPENCSTIIWRDREHVDEVANMLRLTAEDLKSFQVIDEIIAEPNGGAHTDHAGAAKLLDQAITRTLNEIRNWTTEERVQKRYERFRAIGLVQETAAQDRQEKKTG